MGTAVRALMGRPRLPACCIPPLSLHSPLSPLTSLSLPPLEPTRHPSSPSIPRLVGGNRLAAAPSPHHPPTPPPSLSALADPDPRGEPPRRHSPQHHQGPRPYSPPFLPHHRARQGPALLPFASPHMHLRPGPAPAAARPAAGPSRRTHLCCAGAFSRTAARSSFPRSLVRPPIQPPKPPPPAPPCASLSPSRACTRQRPPDPGGGLQVRGRCPEPQASPTRASRGPRAAPRLASSSRLPGRQAARRLEPRRSKPSGRPLKRVGLGPDTALPHAAPCRVESGHSLSFAPPSLRPYSLFRPPPPVLLVVPHIHTVSPIPMPGPATVSVIAGLFRVSSPSLFSKSLSPRTLSPVSLHRASAGGRAGGSGETARVGGDARLSCDACVRAADVCLGVWARSCGRTPTGAPASRSRWCVVATARPASALAQRQRRGEFAVAGLARWRVAAVLPPVVTRALVPSALHFTPPCRPYVSGKPLVRPLSLVP